VSSCPNILLITTDQHRYDAVGFMGSREVKTPHLDALAAAGVVFERTYVTNPVCMASRATWLTGQFPDAHGVRRNGIPAPDVPWGLGRTLAGQGWRTGLFGKTHFQPLRRDFDAAYSYPNWRDGDDYYGFTTRAITHDLKDYLPDGQRADRARAYNVDDYLAWIEAHHPDLSTLARREGLADDVVPAAPELWTSQIPPELHQSTWVADRTIDFMDAHEDAPFFAWCSFVDPHHPFNAPQAYRDLYDAAQFKSPVWCDDELSGRSIYHHTRYNKGKAVWAQHWREYRAQYYAMITLIDDQVGRLLAYLRRSGQADNTLVIFTSDHGEMLGDHGVNRKGFFHYEPLIRLPWTISWPGVLPGGLRQSGIVQSVDLPATILDLAGVSVPEEFQGISLAPWCRGERTDAPRPYALITNGTPGPDHDPNPELRTLVTDRWKLNYYSGGHIELDDLHQDPLETAPLDVAQHPKLVQDLMSKLIDATSAAIAQGPHIGRW
jgi:arylsulfatase A-like enzyme